MSDRPSFQFYPADWLANANLRRCSEAARGIWIDVMCVLHGADEYGVIRWPLADLARAANASLKLVKELADKGVLKGADKNAADYRWAPTHAGQKGDEVTLVVAGEGPVWYCSRFVKDEYKRQRRGANNRFTTEKQPPKKTPTEKPKPSPKVGIGDAEGDGAISPSSKELPEPNGSGADAPIDAAAADPLWHTGLNFLIRKGIAEKPARSFIGKLKAALGDINAGALLAQAEAEDITDPVPWLRVHGRALGAPNATTARLSAAERVRAHAIEGELADQRAGAGANGHANLVGSNG